MLEPYFSIGGVELYCGDCLEVMPQLDCKVDMVLCDLPYGTTACKWDTVIPFEPLWTNYRRLVKGNGAMVFTASQPFTTSLIGSNLGSFRYCWYWDKGRVTGFANAKLQPLRCIEDIPVFYDSRPLYAPQNLVRINKIVRNGKGVGGNTLRTDVDASEGRGKLRTTGSTYIQEFTGYPRQVVSFSSDSDKTHPTQKPVALFEYLIRTYTNEGETVLDNCCGSGTTGVACINTNRKAVLIEKDEDYCAITAARLLKAMSEHPGENR
jgi:site-specific DNA-methyltransferase (adenine-specific)